MIYAGTRGFLDKIEVAQVSAYEARLLEDVRANGKDILDAIATKQKLDDELEAKMKDFLQKFTDGFAGSVKKAA